MEIEPARAMELCSAAHQRLLLTTERIDDEVARRRSLLPDWTVGHVLTHLARNADSHTRRLSGALEGHAVPRYEGGSEQRNREIDEGEARTALALRDDLAESIQRLEAVWRRSHEAGWPNADLLAGGDRFPTSGSPARRLREVEMHHVDLGLGYGPEDWPEEYVAWELPRALESLPERLRTPGDDRHLLAWLTGRGPLPEAIGLDPWM